MRASLLRAVRETGAGIVLVAGTGSIAYAQDAAGASFRAGGYGYLLGDDGSGFAIGLAAARHLARVLDGRSPADPLSEQTAQSLEAATQAALFDRIYGDPERVSSLASLAKRVIEQADRRPFGAQDRPNGRAGIERSREGRREKGPTAT